MSPTTLTPEYCQTKLNPCVGLTASEACVFLGVRRHTVYRYVHVSDGRFIIDTGIIVKINRQSNPLSRLNDDYYDLLSRRKK